MVIERESLKWKEVEMVGEDSTIKTFLKNCQNHTTPWAAWEEGGGSGGIGGQGRANGGDGWKGRK